jgi:hypothetical protein
MCASRLFSVSRLKARGLCAPHSRARLKTHERIEANKLPFSYALRPTAMSLFRRKSKSDATPAEQGAEPSIPNLSVPKPPSVSDWEQGKLMERGVYLAQTYNDIRGIVAEFSQNNGLGFEQEFDSLKESSEDPQAKASQHPKNQHLNRFRNISAYDHSRVVLSELSTDYINANWIAGYKQRHAYIASQGPVTDSFAHFWYMVWQNNVR